MVQIYSHALAVRWAGNAGVPSDNVLSNEDVSAANISNRADLSQPFQKRRSSLRNLTNSASVLAYGANVPSITLSSSRNVLSDNLSNSATILSVNF